MISELLIKGTQASLETMSNYNLVNCLHIVPIVKLPLDYRQVVMVVIFGRNRFIRWYIQSGILANGVSGDL